jgi:hypothetical protein
MGAAGEGQAGGETEVFVLLPELADQHIPVVDTEEVSADITEGMEDIAVLSRNPAATEVHKTSVLNQSPLEEIVTDLEDEILTTEVDLGGPAAADEGPTVVEDDLFRHRGHALEAETPYLPAPRRRGGLKKVVLPLAAALIVGVSLFYYFYPEWRPLWLGQLIGGKPVATKGGGTQNAGKAGSGAVSKEVAASLQTFREKLLVSLELGFSAEAKHE